MSTSVQTSSKNYSSVLGFVQHYLQLPLLLLLISRFQLDWWWRIAVVFQ